MNPTVQPFFDPATWTMTYVVYDQPGSVCAIIDPVLDYDPKSGRTRTVSADKVVAFVRDQRLQVQWILETHAHADHITAAPYLRRELGGKIAIGSNITQVQARHAPFHVPRLPTQRARTPVGEQRGRPASPQHPHP